MDEYVFGQFRCIFAGKKNMIRCLSIATVLTGMAITLNAQNMKPLTPEEERVIVRKGTEAPFPVNITSTTKTAPTAAAGAVLRCTVRRINSMPAAAGPASMMKFRVPCAANRMPTDAVRRFSAPSAEPIWATSLRTKDLPLKYAPLREFPLPRFRTGGHSDHAGRGTGSGFCRKA